MTRFRWLLAALVLPLAAASAAAAVSPREGSVVRITGTDYAERTRLSEEVDVWGYQAAEGELIAFLTPEELVAWRQEGFTIEVMEEDTERLERGFTPLPGQGAGIPGFPCYRTVEETFADLGQIALDYPDLARWVDIGDSWNKDSGSAQGYDIQVLVLGNQNAPGPKAPFLLMAAMHARELATAELVTRFAEQLVAGYGVDPDLTWLLDHTEVHVVPHLNPDGRKQAESGSSWRKNVDNRYCTGTNTRGADLNRNSSFGWGGAGSSSSECNLVFRGHLPASEPETQAIEAYMAQVFEDQRGPDVTDAAPPETTGLFVSIHSHGGLVLFPWEHVDTPAPNKTSLQTLGRKLGFYNNYVVCQDCLYAASGTAPDQAYGEYGVAAYTFEIGNAFFQTCASFESDVLPRNLAALFFALKAARRPHQEPAGPEVVGVALGPGPSPLLTATADDTRYDSNGQGNEPSQNVVAVYYSIDTPPWQATSGEAMSPADGSFNETAEAATAVLDTSTLSHGRHTVYVYAEDAAGNVGPATAVFLDVDTGLLFADSFESADTSAWSGGQG